VFAVKILKKPMKKLSFTLTNECLWRSNDIDTTQSSKKFWSWNRPIVSLKRSEHEDFCYTVY